MKQRLTEEREIQYSERFASGESPVDGETEERVHRAYRRNRQALCDLPVPGLDHAALAERLIREARPRRKIWSGWLPNIQRAPAPAFAAASFLLLCGMAAVVSALLGTPDVPPAKSCQFFNYETGESVDLPFLLERRMQRGSLVTVPVGARATIELADGSLVRCSPGSQVAFQMGRQRRITLRAGSIAVVARHDPSSPMKIDAGLGTVTVVGTEFTVTLVR